MYDKSVLNFCSVITGVFFIISGVGKLLDVSAFSNLLYQYGLGYFKILAPLIIIIEILLGVLLVLLINPKQCALFSFALLLIFTMAFAYGHFYHGVNNCACFGTLQPANISPAFSFIRNFILLGLSLFVWLKYPDGKFEMSQWKKTLILSVLCISAFIAGLTFNTPSPTQTVSTPVKFNYLYKDVKTTILSKYVQTVPNKKYLFFCFSYGCPHCWNSIANLEQYKKMKAVDTIVAFAVGANADKQFFYRHFNPGFHINDISSNEMDKITDRYPTAFFIAHNTIKVFLQAELPSPVTFENIMQL